MKLCVLAALAGGCGVTSAAMRLSHIPFGEGVPDERHALHLDTAPADIAVVGWRGGTIACGRVTDIHVIHRTYTFTPVMKFSMLFLGTLGEGLGGTLFLSTAHGNSDAQIAGAIMLGDAALALAGALLWNQREERSESDTYGLAYQCNPGDGIAIGERVAPVTKDGELSEADRAALREELAAGKPLRLVVDRKVVGVPLDEPERCTATGGDGCNAPNVLVTLTRVPSVLRLPMLPDPPPPPQATTTAGGTR